MVLKRSITFQLALKKENGVLVEKNIPIVMCITFYSHRVTFRTGLSVDLSGWDKKKQRVENSFVGSSGRTAAYMNAKLNELESSANGYFEEFEKQSIIPTKSRLRAAFNKDKGFNKFLLGETSSNIIDMIGLYADIQGKERNWKKHTKDQHNYLVSHLSRYNPDISINDISLPYLTGFEDYLIGLNLSSTSVYFYKNLLKRFLKWAKESDYTKNCVYKSFPSGYKKTTEHVVFLSIEELEQLRAYKLPGNKSYLEIARDIFLFMSFTGLRYPAVCNLDFENIKGDCIVIPAAGSGDTIIELNDTSRKLIEKYKTPVHSTGKIFPYTYLIKMNDDLKELARLAGITSTVQRHSSRGRDQVIKESPKCDLLSTNSGRWTFIAGAIARGIPQRIIETWSGGYERDLIDSYIEITSEDKRNAMKKFND